MTEIRLMRRKGDSSNTKKYILGFNPTKCDKELVQRKASARTKIWPSLGSDRFLLFTVERLSYQPIFPCNLRVLEEWTLNATLNAK